MYARQWMAVFAESLRLGMKSSYSTGQSFDPSSTHCQATTDDVGVNKDSVTAENKKAVDENTHDTNHSSEQQYNFYDEYDENSDGGNDEKAALLPLHEEEQQYPNSDDDENEKFYKVPLNETAKNNGSTNDDDGYDDKNVCHCSPKCCLNTKLEQSLALIEKITRTPQPIGVLLDLKSRHVPKRVLSLIVKCLQDAGIRVVGIASFQIQDIRGVCSAASSSTTSFNNGRASSGSGIDAVIGTTNSIIDTDGNAATTPPTGSVNKNTRKSASNTTKEILMVHSAGDLQAACDDGLVQPGDHVFFNGGSLILDSARSSTIKTLLGALMDMCVCGYLNTFDPCVIEDGYRIENFGHCNTFNMDSAASALNTAAAAGGICDAYIRPYGDKNRTNTSTKKEIHHRNKIKKVKNDTGDGDDDITLIITGSNDEDDNHRPNGFCGHGSHNEVVTVLRTLADYKRHYGFSMGLYLQEFSIDEAAARLLIDLVNNNPSLYDLGLAWGGINGMTVHGIQPGRFTSTDGYWNQRRLGRTWKVM